MQLHEFVFSNELRRQKKRHLVFWFLWLLYIVFTTFFTPEPPVVDGIGFSHHQFGLHELGYLKYILLVLIKSSWLVLAQLFFYYAVIYILLPNYLSKKKYFHFGTAILLLYSLITALGYVLYLSVYPVVDRLFNLHLAKHNKTIFFESFDASLISTVKLTIVIAAIYLLKHWWFKQKEKEKLEKEKIDTQLQLLKAQIHPTFLFSTLNNIISHARSASPQAPEMLIKLSDLLSYMLYECDAPRVKLEKEISMLKEYITLEKIRQGERLETTFQIKGQIGEQLISPLLLFPFIDNSFSYCDNVLVEQPWVNLNITVKGDCLSMTLLNGMQTFLPGKSSRVEQALTNVQKRLQLLYDGRHELKINAERELLMVHLNLRLEEAIEEHQLSKQPTLL